MLLTVARRLSPFERNMLVPALLHLRVTEAVYCQMTVTTGDIDLRKNVLRLGPDA